MREHLDLARAWMSSRSALVGALSFYVPAGALLLYSFVLMLSSMNPGSSDGLWPFSFAHDLEVGLPLSGWKLPPAPIYFPEVLSVLVWSSLGIGVGTTVLIHGVVTWLLIGLGVCWGARSCGLGWAKASRAAFVVLLAYAYVHGDSHMLAAFLYPFSHGGSALVTFLGIVFVGHGLKNGYRLVPSACAAVCLALVVASDRLTYVQFVLPATLVTAAFWGFGWAPRIRVVWALGVILVGAFLGWLLSLLMQTMIGVEVAPIRSNYTWAAARTTLWMVVEELGAVAVSRPLVLASVAVPTVMLISLSVSSARGRLRSSASRQNDGKVVEHWIALASLAALVCTVTAVIVTHSWSQRYILPAVVLPLALATTVWAPRLEGVSDSVLRTLEVGLLVVIATLANLRTKSDKPVSSMLYPPQFACLDRYVAQEDLHAGFAGYWQSRPPMVLGKSRLTIVQVDGFLKPTRWINNTFWYSRGYWAADRPPRYDFIITKGFDEAWLTSRFGAPRTTESCFEFTIWVYDRPTDLEFRNYLRSAAARVTGDHDGWWESPTLIAARSDSRRAAISFDVGQAVQLEFPRVSANVVEIINPLRSPLTLIYLRSGVEVSRQEVAFEADVQRLMAVPKALGSEGFDSLVVQAAPGAPRGRQELADVTLMFDSEADAARL
jgi:hypothetical protein